MESNFALGPPSSDGTIYQITDVIEGSAVVINITYSGGQDENGVDTLEFEYASAEEDSNPTLTAEELNEVNKILECGREESYVIALLGYYKANGINFDPNEYRYALGIPERKF